MESFVEPSKIIAMNLRNDLVQRYTNILEDYREDMRQNHAEFTPQRERNPYREINYEAHQTMVWTKILSMSSGSKYVESLMKSLIGRRQ